METFIAVQPSSKDLVKLLTSRELCLGLELK